MWRLWSETVCDHNPPRRTVCVCRRHGRLLGVHADRRGLADAGAFAFSHAGVFACAAGLSVCALRNRGHGNEPVRRLACGAVRLTSTLYAGLGLQVAALLALAQLDPSWAMGVSVVFVMLVQGASGVAKDLAKMSSKSAVKLLAPAGDAGLFRWVALLTGSKNMVKGVGFLLGAALLAAVGFVGAVLGMAAVLAVILIAVLMFMPAGLPKGRKDAKFTEVLSKSPNVNWLSAARVVLFGARDVWFVVGIPIYFYAVLSDGTPQGNRTAFFLIGRLWPFGSYYTGSCRRTPHASYTPNRAPPLS